MAVVNVPAKDIFPPSLTVLAALTTSMVRARAAVNVVDDVAPIVTSKAAEVSLIPKVVIAECVPPVIVGDVPNTTDPEPVEVVTPVPPFATANVPVTDAKFNNPAGTISQYLRGDGSFMWQ